MTVCASPGLSAAREQEGAPPPPAADEDGGLPRAGCAITADGAYAARLVRGGGSWYPERWTLDGPEPYAVPLPGNQPEEPGTEVQPMGDGRVLIRRLVAGRHAFSLLYPTGPGTGELLLGAVECPDRTRLRLLPCAPGGQRAYALAVGPRTSAVWLVAGGAFGPELLAEVPGQCSGGVWLDRAGRLLALDRHIGGRTKTVVVDLGRGGEMSPLLQIAPDSDDRLLLADPDSGLLLIRSDAPSPGRPRLGWGVVGSTLPVRFPESLRLPDCVVTPFAVQPGQVLTPEQCGVALRCDGPFGSWVGVWRPAERRVRHLPAPEGWLSGAGLWTDEGALLLPYSTGAVPCGLARWAPPGTRETADTPPVAPPPRPGPAPRPARRGRWVPVRPPTLYAAAGARGEGGEAGPSDDRRPEPGRAPDSAPGGQPGGTPGRGASEGVGGGGPGDGAGSGAGARTGGGTMARPGAAVDRVLGGGGPAGKPGEPVRRTLGEGSDRMGESPIGAPAGATTAAHTAAVPPSAHTAVPIPEPATPLSTPVLAPLTPPPPDPESELPSPFVPRPVTLQQAASTGRMTGRVTGQMESR
ncbi:hypothetical protein ABZ858_01150 [Streptomyces sp. NPDC047017]|uniref:hypothetical protein n=1 Tax=Streptomyces sp. NPDC047017 TaxID=3155024 RepID=UPI0033F4B512